MMADGRPSLRSAGHAAVTDFIAWERACPYKKEKVTPLGRGLRRLGG